MDTNLKTRAQSLILAIAPPVCVVCSQQHTNPHWLCSACRDQIHFNSHPCPRCGLPDSPIGCHRCDRQPPPFIATTAPLHYGAVFRKLLHHWKFGGITALTETLVDVAQAEWCTATHRPDALVPIPCHWRRRWSRGFDQTWLLAHAIRSQMNNEIAISPLLIRRHATPAQHRLSSRKRHANVRGAFEARATCAGLHIALIDDVMTTGATAEDATRALLKAGARTVQVWVLARVPPQPANRSAGII